ncbi:MAG: DUF4400 domain-containing protein [Magnetococcales bacterium]|nr:DUF4400 domain-containing protein [Magnetococcales bacterium]NGZ28003.1 DUF4400 domain-containing protein [Magnetococcales bacterium]
MGRHLTLWIGLLLITPLMVPIVMTTDGFRDHLQNEFAKAVLLLGDQDVFDSLVHARGGAIYAWLAPLVGSEAGSGGRDFLARISDTLYLHAYCVALRISMLSSMWPWIFIPLLGGTVAGYCERQIKNNTFGASHPIVFGASSHMLMVLGGVFCLWIFVPLSLPVWMIPLATMLSSFVVSRWIAHFPRYDNS